jgi:hypothetical protein
MKQTWGCTVDALGYTLWLHVEDRTQQARFHEPLGQIGALSADTRRSMFEWAVQHLKYQALRYLA